MNDHFSEAQARIITKLNQDMRENERRFEAKIAQLIREQKQYVEAGKAWMSLRDQIIANPTLQSEWNRFLTFLKMGAQERYLKIEGEMD